MSSDRTLSKNAHKRALRKLLKRERKEAELTELLLEKTLRDCGDDCSNAMKNDTLTQSTLHSGGKASRARRVRNGETAVGTFADHRPSGGAYVDVLPQHKEIVRILEECETRARLKFRPTMQQRKVVPTDNHGSMEVSRLLSVVHAASQNELSWAEQNLRSLSMSQLANAVSLTSLLSLDLSRNELWDLPDDISGLVNLETLDLSRNWFRCLPKSISHLSRSLRSLYASHNMLRPSRASLQMDLWREFTHLTVLDISCNQKCGRQSLRTTFQNEIPHVTVSMTINYPPQPGSFVGASAAERDATLLRSQLEPWSTTALRRRLVADFGDDVSPPEHVPRSQVMERLLQKYNEENSRIHVQVEGTLVAEEIRSQLLNALQAWSKTAVGANRERTSIHATNYMILISPANFHVGSQKAAKAAAKLKLHKCIWDLAERAIDSLDPIFARKYDALAVTQGFQGSPHIDKQNIGPFYGLALGDFDEGTGGIRVECSARVVATVNTKNRLGKVDGRYPHWVAPYDQQKERYSLIYYQTTGEMESVGPAIFNAPKFVE